MSTHFWIGDQAGAAEDDCMKVMGFASNYAQLFEAIKQQDSTNPGRPYTDSFWAVAIPNPLPAVGAKVAVGGTLRRTFAKGSSGVIVDPVMGILDFESMRELEPAVPLATLPGVKRKR